MIRLTEILETLRHRKARDKGTNQITLPFASEMGSFSDSHTVTTKNGQIPKK